MIDQSKIKMSAPGTNKVEFTIKDGVAVVTLDHYPVNTLTNAVQLGIEDAAEKVHTSQGLKAVVLRGAGTRAFCAGADIQDLNKKHKRYPKKAFMEYFEDMNIPVVCLLQGFTLGGGFELSLGCHYRIITAKGVVGLPEVNIGLLPGGQGTQRLPRIVGPEAALDIMLSGDHIPSAVAKQINLVDDVIPKDLKSEDALLDYAINFALEKAAAKEDLSKRRTSKMPVPLKQGVNYDEYFAKKAKDMEQKRKKQIAPQAIITCVKAAVKAKDFQEGISVELNEFGTVLMSKEARALQHVFFAERAAGKVKTTDKNLKPRDVKLVGVLGAGTMGAGIAMCFANIGISVLLLDREQKFIDAGMKNIKTNYDRSVQRKSRTQASVDKALSLIKSTTEYTDLKNCDLIIEAVFEDLELKKEIFKKLDGIVKEGCIIASNTSYLDIDAMADSVSAARKRKVMGMHFFSPANVMKLLENIQGKDTDEETILTCNTIGQMIGKWPVLVQNRHGFVGNRMLSFYTTEAQNMLINHNVSVYKIDEVALNFGMPMGPFMMNDLTGLDIGYQARKRLNQTNPKMNILDALIESGRLGMKNSKGFYDYKGRNRSASPDAEKIVQQVISNHGSKKGQSLTEAEIEERLFFPIINEGFKVLEEKVAAKPDDIDVVYVHGYNWPRVTGGPMFYADELGLENVLKTLKKYYAASGEKAKYFKPAQLLVDCVEKGLTLQQYWKKFGESYKFTRAEAKL